MNIFTLENSDIELKKNKKSKRNKPLTKNQLNLFPGEAQILFLTLDTGGYFETALRLDEQGDEQASDYYIKAVEHNDSPADAYCNLGVIESEKGNTIKAFSCFLNSLKIEPAHAESHFNIANLYFEMEDYRLAELHYMITIELAEEFSNVYFNLALLYLRMGKISEAEELFLKYKQRTGSDEWIIVDQLLDQLKASVKA